MEEKKLYPFKMIPVEDTPGEVYNLADLGYPDSMVKNGWLSTNTLSEIMEMYMDRVVGDSVFAFYGRQFPVLIKTFSGLERTDLIVHPDDETAAQRFDFLGKAKMWYVTGVEEGAKLFVGFNRDVKSAEFYEACKAGEVENLLNVLSPKVGDCFYIAPGVVHAAGKGVRFIEIAESSPLDFRIFNWGRRRDDTDPFDAELTLEAAFDFIDYRKHVIQPRPDKSFGSPVRLTCNPEFAASELRLVDPLHVRCEDFGSFVAYICVEGELELRTVPETGDSDSTSESYVFSAGETMLVPAEVPDFYLVPRSDSTLLLEAVMDKAEAESDSVTPLASPILS